MAKIHRWSLDEESGALVDSVGGANGTATGTTPVPGIFTNARKFASAGDRIDCGLPADLQITTEPFTFLVWFKLSGTPSTNYYLLARDGSGNRSYMCSIDPSGILQFSVFDSGGTPYSCSSLSPVNDGLWHLAALRRSGTVIDLFIDATLISMAACAASLNVGTSNFIIGNNPNDFNTYYFRDTIDNIEIWNEALSDSTIEGMYYDSSIPSPLVLADQNPVPDDVYIPVGTTVYLAIESTTTNIDLSTVDIWINSQLAFSASGFVSPFTGTQGGNSSKYTFDITPPADFDTYSIVSVRVYAEDDVANILQDAYNFVTRPAFRNSLSRRLPSDADTLRLYRLDEPSAGDAVDISENHSNGSAAGTSAVVVSDQPFAYMRSFTRTNSDVITCSSAEPSDYLSIDVVINFMDISADQAIVFCFKTSPLSGYYLFLAADRALVFGVIADGTHELSFDYTEFLGSIHRICAVYDQAASWLYIDGFAVARLAIGAGGQPVYDTAPLYIGGWPDNIADPKHCDGDIAEVRISSVPRNPIEVFNNTAAVKDPQVGLPIVSGVIATYNFNNPLEGAVVYDDTGYHNGAISGTVPLVPGPMSAFYREIGSSGYIIIPSHVDFNNLKASLVIEVWFTPTGPTGVTRELVLKRGISNPVPFQVRIDTDETVEARTSDSVGRGIVVNTTNTVLQDSLNFLSVGFDPVARVISVHLNEVLTASNPDEVASNIDFDSLLADTNNVTIGAALNSFSGFVHCVRFRRGRNTIKEVKTAMNGSLVVS